MKDMKMIEDDDLKILSVKTVYTFNWHYIRDKFHFLHEPAIKQKQNSTINGGKELHRIIKEISVKPSLWQRYCNWFNSTFNKNKQHPIIKYDNSILDEIPVLDNEISDSGNEIPISDNEIPDLRNKILKSDNKIVKSKSGTKKKPIIKKRVK